MPCENSSLLSLLSSPEGGNSCAECPQSLDTGAAHACRVQGSAQSPAAGVGEAAGADRGPQGEYCAVLSLCSTVLPPPPSSHLHCASSPPCSTSTFSHLYCAPTSTVLPSSYSSPLCSPPTSALDRAPAPGVVFSHCTLSLSSGICSCPTVGNTVPLSTLNLTVSACCT